MNWADEEDYDEAEIVIKCDIGLRPGHAYGHILNGPLMMSMDSDFSSLRCRLAQLFGVLPADLVLQWRPGPTQRPRILVDTETPRTVGMRNWVWTREEIFCTNKNSFLCERSN